MELIKKLTGKNPSEYEPIAKALVDNSDVEMFKKLVQQDDFLFEFIKENVAKRIQRACNKENYRNLFSFLDIYSPSYDTVIAEVLHEFGDEDCRKKIFELFKGGSLSQKAYAAKYMQFLKPDEAKQFIVEIRKNAQSDYEPLMINSIELLSALGDTILKDEAIEKLHSDDEFEQYNAVKFLVIYGAKDALGNIIQTMKKSSFSENIASEIPYLVPISEILSSDYENGLLVLAHIINAIPEIIPLSSVCSYELAEVFNVIISKPLDSASAVVLRLAKEKFEELISNDEYMFDSDKNTKDELFSINNMLKRFNINRLNSLLYDELYEESDFVFFALDFVNEVEELETLIESNNQTLILKTLTILKEKGKLTQEHKETALKHITNDDIKNIIIAI